MPLDRILAVHSVDLLDPKYTKYGTMAVKRQYIVQRKIACRVVPLTAIERDMLARSGYQVSHKILTSSDPGLFQDSRLRFRGTVMRVVPPIQYSAQERVWCTMTMAHTDDNETQTTIQ